MFHTMRVYYESRHFNFAHQCRTQNKKQPVLVLKLNLVQHNSTCLIVIYGIICINLTL